MSRCRATGRTKRGGVTLRCLRRNPGGFPVLATVGIGLATSLAVALFVEFLRARGALPAPSPLLPTPVAPGADHV